MSRPRYEIVANLVEECRNGKPVSSARFQHIVFLLQMRSLPLGYVFRLSDGPVSDGLRMDLQYLEDQGLVSYQEKAIVRLSSGPVATAEGKDPASAYRETLEQLAAADDELLGLAGTMLAYRRSGMSEPTIGSRIKQSTHFRTERLEEAQGLLERIGLVRR